MALIIFVRDLANLDGDPVFASADPAVVREVVQILVRRVERDDRQPPPPKLKSVPKVTPEKRAKALSEASDKWGFEFHNPSGDKE